MCSIFYNFFFSLKDVSVSNNCPTVLVGKAERGAGEAVLRSISRQCISSLSTLYTSQVPGTTMPGAGCINLSDRYHSALSRNLIATCTSPAWFWVQPCKGPGFCVGKDWVSSICLHSRWDKLANSNIPWLKYWSFRWASKNLWLKDGSSSNLYNALSSLWLYHII